LSESGQAGNLELLFSFEDTHADVARVESLKWNGLRAIHGAFAETRDGRTRFHDAPSFGIVAQRHFCPYNEVRLVRFHAHAVIEGSAAAELADDLRVLARSKTVFDDARFMAL